jgi:hypothetical protein
LDGKETFSRATVEDLKSNLTMLDIYRARKISKETVEVGLVAYHQAALRTGIVPEGSSLEEFLGRLRADDFNEIMGATKSSPLESGGESGPAFSAGTDTPRDNS